MQFTTGTVRLSYAHLFEPHQDPSGQDRYSCSLLIRKDSKDVERLKFAFQKILEDPESIKKLGNARNVDIPLRDGDEKDNPEYHGCFYLNAKAGVNNPPKIFDRDHVEIMDRSEVYSGCYVQASISLYVYNKGANRGIGVGLRGIRKIKDGEPLSGSTVTASEFSDDLVKDDLDEFF